jgi:hypothetical protein
MRKILLTLAAVAAAAPALALSPAESNGEAKLARELEGHVAAGEPVDCLDLRRIRSTRIIDRTAIVYDTGRTLYVNRPRAGAESLSNWDVMVTKPFGSQLCRIDTVQLVDRGTHMPSGFVFLGDFVPYDKVKARRAR